jgi:urease accessory protein
VVRLNGIVGFASEPALAERLHRLGHADRVEYLVLDRADTARHRLRAVTDRGTDCAIALDRDQRMGDGAVLLLEDARAIVVRMKEEDWLALAPADAAAALELGYHAGNLHWRVRFRDGLLEVALEGPEAAYLERLSGFFADGRVRRAGDD